MFLWGKKLETEMFIIGYFTYHVGDPDKINHGKVTQNIRASNQVKLKPDRDVWVCCITLIAVFDC